jgi:hypothetical protein
MSEQISLGKSFQTGQPNFLSQLLLLNRKGNGNKTPPLISEFYIELAKRLCFGRRTQHIYAMRHFRFLEHYLVRKLLPRFREHEKKILHFLLTRLSWNVNPFLSSILSKKLFFPSGLFLIGPKSIKYLRTIFMNCVSSNEQFAIEFQTVTKNRVFLKFDCSDAQIITCSACVTDRFGYVLKNMENILISNRTNGGCPMDNRFVKLLSFTKQDEFMVTRLGYHDPVVYMLFFYTMDINLHMNEFQLHEKLEAVMFMVDPKKPKLQNVGLSAA